MSTGPFAREPFPPAVADFLRAINPWWVGGPTPQVPSYRRWAFQTVLRKMDNGLAPAVLLRGPRQVGKSILQQQLIRYLIEERKTEPRRILQVQFDEIPPLASGLGDILSIAYWFERDVLGCTFNEAARDGKPAYLFFDEAQIVPSWAPQLKALVDHHTVKAVVTGSSALRIAAGRDSLAGRVTTVELGPLLLREIAAFRFGNELKPLLPPNGLDCLLQQDFWKELQEHGLKNREVRDKAFRAFSERGGYPIAHAYPETPWPEMADQLNESVIHRAIQHDLIVAQKKRRRDRALLEEVFTLACRYAGDTPGPSAFVPEIRRSLKMDTGWARVLNYLDFLESALLLKLVPPLEMRRTHHQGFDKICLCDHGLRASWLKEVIPLDDAALAVSMAQDLAGHIAESVIGYYLSGLLHLDLGYYPARGLDPEVDFVLAIGQWRIPLEVKYRRHIDPLRDTKGLRAFIEKPFHRAPFGILVTLCDGVAVTDPRIVPVSLPSLLLLR